MRVHVIAQATPSAHSRSAFCFVQYGWLLRSFFAAVQLEAHSSQTHVDRTLEERARGTDVVLATVNKIRESGIFSDNSISEAYGRR